jgi:hypothetical protein
LSTTPAFGVISQVFERILSVAAVMIEHAGRLFFWLTQAENARPLDRSFHLRSSMDALRIKAMQMNLPRKFKRFSTGVGLLLLAVGFSSLGFLSFFNRHPEDPATGLFSESTYSIIGSSISILVGATFLAAAVLFAGGMLRGKRSFAPEWRNGRGFTID